MKKALLTLVVIAALGGGGYAFYKYRSKPAAPTVTTAVVQRGDIADTVGSTGTLQAVTTVTIGTQVSGIVQELYVDFNALVKKGQLLARLDPSTIETQVEQAKANLTRGQADLERLRVTLEDSRNKARRTEELAAKKIVSQTDLESAQVAVKSAEASLKSSEAGLTQLQASLRQLEVNLGYTIITAPIDGLIISRNVDRGQTVQASMNAPTLFILAADLTKMQLLSNIDESDVGRIRPNQHVSFRVDAFPAEDFTGRVTQVRLNPIVQQGVVSYATVIEVENPQLKLKPGMTANVTIEIARRTDVLRVPNAALRFRPTNDMYAALGQTPPEGGLASGGRGDAAGRPGQGRPGERATAPPAAQAAPSQTAGTQQPAGRGNQPNIERRQPGSGRGARGDGGENGAWQNLSAEERERMMRMRGRGGNAAGARGGRQGGRSQQAATPPIDRNSNATTIDALFGPLPTVESRGRVWTHANNELQPISVRLGITDGQATELLEGEIEAGTELVTNIITANESTRPAGSAFPPFMGPGGRGGPGGGRDGGGNRGGGGGGGNNRGGGR